jgi:hypothetical protein
VLPELSHEVCCGFAVSFEPGPTPFKRIGGKKPNVGAEILRSHRRVRRLRAQSADRTQDGREEHRAA